MSSYIKRLKHPAHRTFNNHQYTFLRSYGLRQDAMAEASRWNGEPRMSAKVTRDKGEFWTVWVSDKSKWRRRP